MLPILLAFLAGYLWGGVPTAYLWARFRSGIDIRQYGTGNMGASNVIAHVGARSGYLLGIVDGLVKGTVPVVVTAQLGYSEWVQAAAGLGAVVGHNWSPYMRFTGGRGVATSGGVYLGFGLWPEFLLAAALGGVWGGVVRKNLALWLLPALTLTAPLGLWLGRSPEAMTVIISVVLLLMLKRLAANWQAPLEGEPVVRVLRYRLLLDRDIADRDEWIYRRPDG